MLRKWKAKQKYAKNATAKLMRGVVGVTGAAEAAAQAEDEAMWQAGSSEVESRSGFALPPRRSRALIRQNEKHRTKRTLPSSLAVIWLCRQTISLSLSLALALFINIILIWVSETTWRSSLNLAASCQQRQEGRHRGPDSIRICRVFFNFMLMSRRRVRVQGVSLPLGSTPFTFTTHSRFLSRFLIYANELFVYLSRIRFEFYNSLCCSCSPSPSLSL